MNASCPTGLKKKESLGMHMLCVLRGRILNWQYPPNKPLMEEALCREFGVSRSPVREALRMLAAEGLAERLPNRTFVVKQVHPEYVSDIYELRLALELYVVEQLCRDPQRKKKLVLLRTTWREYMVQCDAGNDVNQNEAALRDQQFHEGLAALHGNKAICETLYSFSEKLHIFRILDFEHPGRTQTTCRQHLLVLDAIDAGDVAASRQALLVNISEGRQNASEGLQKALLRACFEDADKTV